MYDLGGITVTKRKDFRETNYTQDIKGAQHDTVHWKLRTNRVVDPLDPQYVGLDGVPLDDALYRCPTPPNPTSIPPVRSTEAVIAEKEFELRNLSQEIREMRQQLNNTNTMNCTNNSMRNTMSNTGSNIIGKPPRDPSIQPVTINNNNNNNTKMPSINLNNSMNNSSNRSSGRNSMRSSGRRSQTITPNMSRHSSQNVTPKLSPLRQSNPVSPINIEKTMSLSQTVSSIVSGDTSKPIVISHRSNTSSVYIYFLI